MSVIMSVGFVHPRDGWIKSAWVEFFHFLMGCVESGVSKVYGIYLLRSNNNHIT